MKSALILLNFCVLLGQVKLEPLPVIIWHGMGDHGSGEGIQNLARAIEQVFPRVYVKCIITGNTTIQDLEDSYFKPIDQQLKEVCQMLQNDSRFSGGLHMIGISQGGLFVRALAQRCPLKNIGSVVSIGGPQLGVYGLPKCRDFYYIHLCWMMSKLLSYGAYTDFVQEHLVQAQYWHDPLREETYRKKCRFLTDINQENYINQTYRENLLKIGALVLVKFRRDTILKPKESEWFGYYKPGTEDVIYDFQNSSLYKEDRLGLRTLDRQKKVHFLEVDGDHLAFTLDWFINEIIRPFLG